ncbi:MAG TPA: ubiquinol-cytochrome c reductase iron-sulfur subunit [Acidobacteriota bacterium]|nr:ubiquinol-cytochrome c reductase iron-sulfur subunit [Acidobacteriota bacterium]HQM62085.1 ubiquinol-cytochrome c reductase iron-sulfur subunit [Acidobacteriota bacterium]
MNEQPQTPDAPAEPSRRRWLGTAGKILGLVAAAEFAGVAVAFLWPRRSRRDEEASATVTCGPVDEFTPHSVTAFPAGRFYLVRLADGGFLALSRTCTHLGCTVPWDEAKGRFVCPCHASAFDIAGDVLSPPAPRALDLHPVRIENGVVRVDSGRAIQRQRFELSQEVYL